MIKIRHSHILFNIGFFLLLVDQDESHYSLFCYTVGMSRVHAGEPIIAALTRAPGNDADIGGLKVIAESGWFAARPSGTEDIYKVYAESYRSEGHLQRILKDAVTIISGAFEAAGIPKEGIK